MTRFLTIEELAAATTLSVSTLRRLLKKGALVGHQPGGPRHRIVFPPDAIERVAGAAKPGEMPAQAPRDAPHPQRGRRPK